MGCLSVSSCRSTLVMRYNANQTHRTQTTTLSFPTPTIAGEMALPMFSLTSAIMNGMWDVLMLGERLRVSPVDFDFFTLATCCNFAVRLSRFIPDTIFPDIVSMGPTTRLFGVLLRVDSALAEVSMIHPGSTSFSASSPVWMEELSEDDTSPR